MTIKFIRPDGRGWVGLACFVLVLTVLAMIWFDRTLLRDDFFKTLATALIITAWLNGPVGWAYQATKSGGELADRNADLVQKQAETPGTPPVHPVVIQQPADNPVPVAPQPEGA